MKNCTRKYLPTLHMHHNGDTHDKKCLFMTVSQKRVFDKRNIMIWIWHVNGRGNLMFWLKAKKQHKLCQGKLESDLQILSQPDHIIPQR